MTKSQFYLVFGIPGQVKLQVELIFGVQIRIISPVNAGSFLRKVVALCCDAAIVQKDKAVAGIFRESTGSICKNDKLIMFVDRTFPSKSVSI